MTTINEKLELKHIAPYLPYGLEFMALSEPNEKEPNISELKGIDMGLKMVNFGWGNAKELNEIKPILRPLSDLTKEIEHNGVKTVLMEALVKKTQTNRVSFIETDEMSLSHLSLEIWNTLFKWHFDVFGLIEKGLAIDKNTIYTEPKSA